jgi:actin-related protein
VKEFGANNNGGCLVVDSGYAFSHAVPYRRSACILPAVRRLDVGGRTLTNFLKVRLRGSL